MSGVERDLGVNLQVALDKEKENAREELALETLFLILESEAKREGIPVNSIARGIPIELKSGDIREFFLLRVNPVFLTRGKLNIAILDLYGDSGSHFQQWVVRANWKDGKPQIIGLDRSILLGDGGGLELADVAEVAGKVISGKIPEAIERNKSNFLLKMPPEYSPRIN